MPPEFAHNTGQRALRKGRYSERNRLYHVTARTFRSALVFANFIDARILIRALHVQETSGLLKTFAFVVMPDHLHWLFQLTGNRPLSTCVNLAKSLSTREIHRDGNYRGNVWQRGFYDRAIRHDADLVAVARYIVANPLRTELVESLRDYPHWNARWV